MNLFCGLDRGEDISKAVEETAAKNSSQRWKFETDSGMLKTADCGHGHKFFCGCNGGAHPQLVAIPRGVAGAGNGLYLR